jgi:hypothetical protein
MFYPLTRIYGVEFDKEFLCCRSSRPRSRWQWAIAQSDASDHFRPARARHDSAVALVCIVAGLLALGYVTKFSEDFSRGRYVGAGDARAAGHGFAGASRSDSRAAA